jgi:hypothetical protein
MRHMKTGRLNPITDLAVTDRRLAIDSNRHKAAGIVRNVLQFKATRLAGPLKTMTKCH